MVEFLRHLLARSAGAAETPVRPRPVSLFERGPRPETDRQAERPPEEREDEGPLPEQDGAARQPRLPETFQAPPLRTIVIQAPAPAGAAAPRRTAVDQSQFRPEPADRRESTASPQGEVEVAQPSRERLVRPAESGQDAVEHTQRGGDTESTAGHPQAPRPVAEEAEARRPPDKATSRRPTQAAEVRPAEEPNQAGVPALLAPILREARPAGEPAQAIGPAAEVGRAERPAAVAPRPAEKRPERPAKRDAEPVIEVTIGRIEVRASRPEKPAPAPKPKPQEPAMSLAEYLERRAKGKLP